MSIMRACGVSALAICCMTLLSERAQSQNFSRTELQILHGDGFRLGSNGFGENEVSTLSIDHFSKGKFGSLYFFFDFTQERDGSKQAEIYGEVYPALSVTPFLGMPHGSLVKDIAISPGLNIGSNTGVFLPGVQVELNVPFFKYFSFQAYAYDTFKDRFDRDLDTTYQLTMVWDVPLTPWSNILDLRFRGFIDYIGPRGLDLTHTIVTQPQLRLDAGRLLGLTADRVFVGAELRYFHNKFGNRGVDEKALQALVAMVF